MASNDDQPTVKVFERWRKLYTMEHDTGSSDNEKATAVRLREALEAQYPGLANKALRYESEYRAQAQAQKSEATTADDAFSRVQDREKTGANTDWDRLFQVDLETRTAVHVSNPVQSKVKEGLAQWSASTWKDEIGGPTRIDRGGAWEQPVVGVHPFHRDRGGNFGGSGFGGL